MRLAERVADFALELVLGHVAVAPVDLQCVEARLHERVAQVSFVSADVERQSPAPASSSHASR